jgi:nucleoside-diphosphate-sugar epimerase
VTTALVGHTGLVGSNLRRQAPFDALYHRASIESIAGRSFDLLVCAAAPAQKWLANADPAADRANLARLLGCLAQVRAREVVLISTVDVFPDPVEVDEESPIEAARQHPYGRHRHELERELASRFPTRIVRLPALFGDGLKKNVVYDLLHDNQVEKIHADSLFQFYDLDRLWMDVQVARAAGLGLVHLATEPTSVRDVARAVLGREFDNRPPGAAARYDMRSHYADLFGGRDGYLMTRGQVLARLAAFTRRVQNGRADGDPTGRVEPGLAG